jgi:hypothetical protein
MLDCKWRLPDALLLAVPQLWLLLKRLLLLLLPLLLLLG